MMKKFRYEYLLNDGRTVLDGRGRNVIPPPVRESLWMGFLKKFTDPIIIILLVVFALSVGVSIYEIMTIGKAWTVLVEPMGILIALLLATGVGFVFEVRAESAFRVLNQRKDERPVKVVRWMSEMHRQHGTPQTIYINKKDVVVGDIVKLENGDEIPADGTVLTARSLMVDESSFTGEMYCNKYADEKASEYETTYPCNKLLRGTTVIEGSCVYVVTAVGLDTEEGRGAKIMNEEDEVETPLNQQLDQLGNWITKASYVVAALIVVGRLIYFFWFDGNPDHSALSTLECILNSIMIAVTLIVVAVPEGLPMSVTISLALSMRRMLKENNLVRKLHACETMGAATVICTDKTGTLTRNKLRVLDMELYDDKHVIAEGVALNSTAELTYGENDKITGTIGNPTEGALIYWIRKVFNLDYRNYRDEAEIIEQEPFSSEKKRMTTIARVAEGKGVCRFVKGAPEMVLAMCDVIGGGHSREDVEKRLAEMQSEGKRTLAFAYQVLNDFDAETHTIDALETGKVKVDTPLIFAGFVGMADPVREGVAEAIEECKNAGVRVVMVTGDVALTANDIARETGIMTADEPDEMLTGQEFEAMTDDELKRDILPTLKVLSRARPADKARLVTLLQEMGEVVAVTGDGTNDAPALKKAQVGLSMGDGTSRAKEASDITIIDNSFVSINTAILWGRSLYLNIRRFILFQMTINVCACLIVLCGAFMGLDSPLNVTQMLWVNLIMDTFAAIALSSLPADRRVMKDKPRDPQSMIIDRGMARQMVGMGMLFFLLLFGLWQLLWHIDITSVSDLLRPQTWVEYINNFFVFTHSKAHLSKYELGIFFTFFVILQFWNLFNARYFRTDRSAWQDLLGIMGIRKYTAREYARGFIIIALVIIVGQVVIVNCFGDMFGVAALSPSDWMWVLLITCPVLIIFDLWRIIRNH